MCKFGSLLWVLFCLLVCFTLKCYISLLTSVAWIIASFLPLPPAPMITPPATPDTPNIAHDIEKALGPIDQARYENARWWRNINRVMSIIGIFIILAIVRSCPRKQMIDVLTTDLDHPGRCCHTHELISHMMKPTAHDSILSFTDNLADDLILTTTYNVLSTNFDLFFSSCTFLECDIYPPHA